MLKSFVKYIETVTHWPSRTMYKVKAIENGIEFFPEIHPEEYAILEFLKNSQISVADRETLIGLIEDYGQALYLEGSDNAVEDLNN
jgi:hypothetical protein